jgi:hypothetical protein
LQNIVYATFIITPRILSFFLFGGRGHFICPPFYTILPYGMIGTIVTVTLEITNISSSPTLYTTTMYTTIVPVIE